MVLHLYKGGQLKKSLLLKKDLPGRFFTLDESEITVQVRDNGQEKDVTVLEGGRAVGSAVVTERDIAYVNLRAQLFGSVALAR